MSNILGQNQASNPIGGSLYIVIGGLDYYIDIDDLANLQTNQSIRFNQETLPSGSSKVLFATRTGQGDFADTNYLLICSAVDSNGLLAPVKVPVSGYDVDGFDVENESGISLTFKYIALKL